MYLTCGSYSLSAPSPTKLSEPLWEIGVIQMALID